MEEIKVKITGFKQGRVDVEYGQSRYVYSEFTIQPVSLVERFDLTKKYKLVEDMKPTVAGYCKKDVKMTRKLITSTTYGVFGKAKVMFNGNATILEIGDFKTVVKCHEEDFFTEHVGLGLALNRYYKKKSKEINVLTFYIEDYTKLAEFCLWKFVNYDKKQFKQLLAKITNCEKGKWIELG